MRRSGDRVGAANAARSAEPTSAALDARAIDIGVTYVRGALAPEAGWSHAPEETWRPRDDRVPDSPTCGWCETGSRGLTLDLLGPGMTVFTGSEGERWRAAAPEAAEGVGVDIRVLVVGGHGLLDPAHAFEATYGLDWDGAVVVRPDGHIAWRCRSSGGSRIRTGTPARDRGRARGACGGSSGRGSGVTAQRRPGRS